MEPDVASSSPWGTRLRFKTTEEGKKTKSTDKGKADGAAHKALNENIPESTLPTRRLKAVIKEKGDVHGISPSPNPVQTKSQEQAIVKIFLSEFSPPDVSGVDKKGWSPLTRAIAENKPEMVRLLVKEVGANVDGVDKNGWTPLTYAVAANKPEMIRLFVKELRADLNGVDKNGSTPLTYAVATNKSEMVRMLVELGADIDKANKGFTPLTTAVKSDKPEMVKLLGELGADLNKFIEAGWTPLTYAVAANKSEMVKLLKELGADIDRSDGFQVTPLTVAVSVNKLEMIKLLGELGADLNKVDDRGCSALTMAVVQDKPEMVALLKDKANSDFEPLERKFLAHAWGIKGFSEFRRKETDQLGIIPYEGLWPTYTMKMLSKYARAFFDEIKESSIPKETRDQLVQAIEKGFPDGSSSSMAARVQRGEPVIISAGFQKHAISMVLFKGQLAICNRGRGRKKNAVEFYSFPSEQVTQEMIEKFTKIYSDLESFNQMLRDLKLEFIEGYNQKDQAVGNCSWASPKASFGALCHLYLGKQPGREIYKKFTAFTRERSLESYLQQSTSPDKNLILKIEEKKQKKLKGLTKDDALIITPKPAPEPPRAPVPKQKFIPPATLTSELMRKAFGGAFDATMKMQPPKTDVKPKDPVEGDDASDSEWD